MEASNLKLRGASMTKPPLGIVPDHALVGVSRVLEDSSVKYAPGNFLAQTIEDALAVYDSAMLRHRLTCRPLSGVVTPAGYAALDEDSGLPHIDHMIAGLLIIRTLMIRDGVLPEDPGMGKRKRASFESERAIAASHHMGIAPGDVTPRSWDEALAAIKIAELVAARQPIAELVIESRELGGDWHAEQAPADPDAERRAAAERNLEQLKRDQAKLAAEKRAWDHRCLACNGTGGDVAGAGFVCSTCKGTGQKTGAEGVRQ